MRKVLISPVLSLLLILLFSSVVLALSPGDQAPDFQLPTLDGKKAQLSDYKGQVIILKLATTWCPTCRQQSEEIEEIAKSLQEKNVAVVEVFLQDSETMVRQYFEGKAFPMPHLALIDDGQVHKAYNVYLIPRVLIISPELKVVRDGSLMVARDLMHEVDKALGKR